jgi:hypothetical protein
MASKDHSGLHRGEPRSGRDRGLYCDIDKGITAADAFDSNCVRGRRRCARPCMVASLSHPEGNTRGFANNFASFGGKWLELLKVAPLGSTGLESSTTPKTSAAYCPQ